MLQTSDEICPRENSVLTPTGFTPLSCLDYSKKGYKSCGYYQIYDSQGRKFAAYCDMKSEPGAVWTLVISFALKNVDVNQFRQPLQVNAPVNPNSPSWDLYRMSQSQLTHLKSQSTHWRATCNFPTYGIDYTDYVRANFQELDIMNFKGDGVCLKVEYVNIRGHQCAECTARWSHYVDGFPAHIDSFHVDAGCKLDASQGAVSVEGGEDNFGFYYGINNKFRCTSDGNSTTNWWFGGYQ